MSREGNSRWPPPRTSGSKARARRHGRTRTTRGRAGDRGGCPAIALERAISTGDAAAVCASLAPESLSGVEESGKAECADAIPESRLPVRGSVRTVDVYGRQARVVLASDILFLSQFADGWKVVAAGCGLRAGHPYQCAVQGG